ncbi:circadian clock-controlled protein-like [Thrips palmi]|uniref:Circadian clock-controlled protein-like n=1 Tax=Thrips palmi TaxID=161013 RepID=A0A6P8YEL3_THRPL|nr:circadian clock-controlled protein-like [Thrips palmi]
MDTKTLVSAAAALLCLAVTCGTVHGGPVPPFYEDILKQCNVKDQDSLDQCLYHILNSMRSYLPDGIPEWNIPVLEPLAIKGISLNQGGGNTRIRATFKDLKVSGLSNYTITYVKSNPEKYKFSIGLQFPKLRVTGEYNIFGNLLLIPIKGNGPFWAVFQDVKADSYNTLEVVHTEGPANPGCLHLSHTQTDFDITKVQLRLEKLFNNDEFLGETVNTFLNENAHDIIREVKPQFAQEIDRLVARGFSEAIAALPVNLWEDLAKKGQHRDKDADTQRPSTATNQVATDKKSAR